MILSVEPLEALRYLDYLKPDGIVVTSSTPFRNIPDYPDVDKVLEAVRRAPRQRHRRFREAGQGGRHGQGPEHRPARRGRVVPDPQGGEPSRDDRRPVPRPGHAGPRSQPQGLRARPESGPRLMRTRWARTIRVLERAEKDGRNFLLEPEVYEILKDAGIPTPRLLFVPAGGTVRPPGPRRARARPRSSSRSSRRSSSTSPTSAASPSPRPIPPP